MQHHYIYLESFNADRANVVTLSANGEIIDHQYNRPLNSLMQAQDPLSDNLHTFDTETHTKQQTHNDSICHVILSDHLVASYNMDLNIKNRQQLEKAAPYAIEDILPKELDFYHIVTRKLNSGKAGIRCLPIIRMQELLDTLARYRLQVQSIVIESDLQLTNNAQLLIKAQDSALATPNNDEVLDFDNANLSMLSKKIFALLKNVEQLDLVYSQDNERLVAGLTTAIPEDLRINKIIRDDHYFQRLAQQAKNHQGINLLQGQFKAIDVSEKTNNYWQYTLGLACLSGVLLTCGILAQTYFIGQKVDQKEAEVIQMYSEKFGGRAARDINELTNFVRSKGLHKANAQVSTSVSELALLEIIAESAQSLDIKLIGFNFENERCDLVVNANSVNSLNQYKDTLEQKLTRLKLKSLERTSVNAKDSRYQGTFKIQF